MAKKVNKVEKEYRNLIDDLEREFKQHANILKHGTNDPFWEDGCNLWLTRNHIIHGKRKIKELCEENNIPLPDIVNRPTPEEVPRDYMAPNSKAARIAYRPSEHIEIQYGQLELPI